MDRYYDLVLGLIPVALLGLGGSLFLVGLGLQVAVSIAGLSAALLIGHALFVNGPAPSTPARTEESSAPGTSGIGPVNAD